MVRLVLILLLLLKLASVQGQHKEELRKSIYFGGGSYEIEEYQAEELFYWLDSIPNLLEKFDIQLISHTDPIGGKEFNEWLSRMRSDAVFQLLVRKHIPERKISIKDWGLDNPVYSNGNYSGMVMNRRVDVILYPVVF